MTDNLTDQTIASIVNQWHGGEHRLAGRRASELAFGNSKTPNQGILDRITAECPDIGQFISIPEVPVNFVADNKSEFAKRAEQDSPANKSPDSSKADQDAIDKTLEAGRLRGEKAQADQNLTGSTKMNPPEGPATAPTGNPADPVRNTPFNKPNK